MKKFFTVLGLVLAMAASASAQSIAEGEYIIHFGPNQKYVLGIDRGEAVNSNYVSLYKATGDKSQIWKVTHHNGKIAIRNAKNTDLVMDVRGNAICNETPIQIYTYLGGNNQLWVPEKQSNGYYVLLCAANRDFCLDLHNGEAVEEGFIKLYEAHRGAPQQWKFEKVSSTTTTATTTTTTSTRPTTTTTTTSTSTATNGVLGGYFTVNARGGKVRFSKGNLQYQASTNKWRFAEHQWDIVGHRYEVETDIDNRFRDVFTGTVANSTNELISASNPNWIDLFGWGTSGTGRCKPYLISLNAVDYGPGRGKDIAGTANDWGVNCAISNGGNKAGQWRTLTSEEWTYLMFLRNTTSGMRFAYATVNKIHGLILLPDNWTASTYRLKDVNDAETREWETINKISASDWTKLETAGAVFLPCGGKRGDLNYDTMIDGDGTGPEGHLPFSGNYWSATSASYDPTAGSWGVTAYYLYFGGNVRTDYSMAYCYGLSVRLVTDK